MTSRCDVRIVGIGGVGCRVVDLLGREWTDGPDRIAAHTRAEALRGLAGARTLQLGERVTGGFSTGGDPETGRQAAEADTERLRSLLDSAHVVLIVAGLGGGTGSGAAPVIAKLARDCGALTLVFCTLPFFFEGSRRRCAAEESLATLRAAADAVIAFPNQRLLEWVGPNEGVEESFRKAGEVLASSLRALWFLLSRNGAINLDLADVRHMAKHAGGVLSMAQAEARGADRAAQAARLIQNSPLLEHGGAISAAQAVLVGALGSPDMTLLEVQTVFTGISEWIRPGASVRFGALVDPESVDRIHLTVLVAEPVGAGPAPTDPERPAPENTGGESDSPGAPRGGRKAGALRSRQGVLPLDGVLKGRFADVEPTLFGGQNLDVPTFIRKGVRLSQNS